MEGKEAQLPETKTAKLRIYVHPRARAAKWAGAIGVLATLVGATGLIAGGIWFGVMLILNPNFKVSLNGRFFTETTSSSVAPPEHSQTLEQIKAEIVQKELIPGEPIVLNPQATAPDLLLPVMAVRPSCQTDCQQIVELRVYHPTLVEMHYRLASFVAVSAPTESFVRGYLHNAASDKTNPKISVPLTEVSLLNDKAPAPGVWIDLTGKLTKNDKTVAVGQLLHYNPRSDRLSLMLSWANPTRQAPYWQKVTSDLDPRLVVNQTVGMEPDYRVYQILPRNFPKDPIYLKEISLSEPAIDQQTYRNALMLAENGLWSTAWKELQSLNKKKLPPGARAQIDLIRLHAEVTQSQSETIWASPSEQVNAFLINGSWQDALEVFKSSDYQNRYEIAMSLKTDSKRLWKRVEAAIAFKPEQDVKAWGTLIKSVQQGRLIALAWLQQQPQNTPETMASIQEILSQLDVAKSQVNTSDNHFSQIVGNAKPLTQLSPADWLQPNPNSPLLPPPLQLESQQIWYQVQVIAFNDGQRPISSFSDLKLSSFETALQLWKLLGLNTDDKILLTVWTPDGKPQNIIAKVLALQIKSGVLQLLASGETLPVEDNNSTTSHQILAYTQAALELVESNSTTLSDLNQQQPLWVSAILPALWRELQDLGYLKPGRVPSVPSMLQLLGKWSVQIQDLNGNKKPEAVLTISQNLLKSSSFNRLSQGNRTFKPHTLIFSDKGKILYNEFTQNAGYSFTAIAQMGDEDSAALVVNDSSNYSIKRWSPRRQRFE